MTLFKMEWGSITLPSGNFNWTQLNFQLEYEDPVIVCTPRYSAGETPRAVRVRNLTSTGCELALQALKSGATAPETIVSYLVMEAGVWDLSEAPFKCEAGKVTVSEADGSANWWTNGVNVSWGQSYSGTPTIFAQVLTVNNTDYAVAYVHRYGTDQQNPPSFSDSGFYLGFHQGELTKTAPNHGEEVVGYIVIAAGTDGNNKIGTNQRIRTGDVVTGDPYQVNISGFSQAPEVVIATQQEMDGSDGSFTIVNETASSYVKIEDEEDQFYDDERNHTDETCAIWAFESAGSFQIGWLEGWNARKWHKIQGSSGGQQTDYQIKLIIHYGTGTDYYDNDASPPVAHIYCGAKCKSDFGDIRFTDFDGVTELSYWIEEKICLLYTSPSPRDLSTSRMPSSA